MEIEGDDNKGAVYNDTLIGDDKKYIWKKRNPGDTISDTLIGDDKKYIWKKRIPGDTIYKKYIWKKRIPGDTIWKDGKYFWKIFGKREIQVTQYGKMESYRTWWRHGQRSHTVLVLRIRNYHPFLRKYNFDTFQLSWS